MKGVSYAVYDPLTNTVLEKRVDSLFQREDMTLVAMSYAMEGLWVVWWQGDDASVITGFEIVPKEHDLDEILLQVQAA